MLQVVKLMLLLLPVLLVMSMLLWLPMLLVLLHLDVELVLIDLFKLKLQDHKGDVALHLQVQDLQVAEEHQAHESFNLHF